MVPFRRSPALPPPRFLFSKGALAVLLIVLLVPFFLPIPPTLRRHPVISPLGDQLHVVLLGAIALLLYWRGPLTGRIFAAAAGAALVGGAIEFVQIPFGRQCAFGDFETDLVGIGIVVGLVLWRGHGRRAGFWLMLALLLLVPWRLRHVPVTASAAFRCRDIFPELADLEGPHDLHLWDANQAEVAVVDVPDSPTGPGHVLRITADPSVSWATGELRRFPSDWSAYDTLLVDVRAVSDAPGERMLTILLDDYLGRREKNTVVAPCPVGRAWRTVRVPLRDRLVDDGSRDLDLTDMDRIRFVVRRDSPPVVEIDDIRLARAVK